MGESVRGQIKISRFSDEKAAEISTVLNAMIEGGIIVSLAKRQNADPPYF